VVYPRGQGGGGPDLHPSKQRRATRDTPGDNWDTTSDTFDAQTLTFHIGLVQNMLHPWQSPRPRHDPYQGEAASKSLILLDTLDPSILRTMKRPGLALVRPMRLREGLALAAFTSAGAMGSAGGHRLKFGERRASRQARALSAMISRPPAAA